MRIRSRAADLSQKRRRMRRQNLHKWMLEFAVLHGVDKPHADTQTRR